MISVDEIVIFRCYDGGSVADQRVVLRVNSVLAV